MAVRDAALSSVVACMDTGQTTLESIWSANRAALTARGEA
jgi:hypothetical protein